MPTVSDHFSSDHQPSIKKMPKKINRGALDEPDSDSTDENDFLHLNGHQFCVFSSRTGGLMGRLFDVNHPAKSRRKYFY